VNSTRNPERKGFRYRISVACYGTNTLQVQTKFTSLDGQDLDNLPYDPAAPLEQQVHASVASSLSNLTFPAASRAQGSSSSTAPTSEPYIDSLVLHSPLRTLEETLLVWQTLSSYVPHRIRTLGLANCPLAVLEHLLASDPAVPPSVIQNRFYGRTAFESPLRATCRAHGIVFQTFWTLTGNAALLKSRVVGRLAESAGVGREVALYALVLGLRGTTVLDGTTSEEHMREDLGGVEKISAWAKSSGQVIWEECLREFKEIIGDVNDDE
jgi:hypothetical protein